MRTIKFRGKRIDNGEWLYGNIQVPKPPFDKYFMWDSNHNQIEVISNSIGQFSGLLDKNGKEIYEGDIVRFTNNLQYISSIEFDSGCYMCNSQNYATQLTFSLSRKVEVIGNIHNNPELLNQ